MLHIHGIVVLTALLLAGNESSLPRPTAEDIEVSLLAIRELRVIELPAGQAAHEDEFFFTMSGDAPSLTLEWRALAPAGATLVSVSNLRDVQAADSTGRNLVPDDLEGALSAIPRFEFGDFGDEPREILDSLTIALDLPDRSATSFSFAAIADAAIATGTAEVTVALTDQWQTLAAEQFGGEAVRVRANREMGEVLGVEFSPAAAAERAIHSLKLNVEGEQLEDSGSMNDYSTITYFFDAGIEADVPAELAITVRTGLSTVPLRFEVKDQDLP